MTRYQIDPRSYRSRYVLGGTPGAVAENAEGVAGRSETGPGGAEEPERTRVFGGGTQVSARTQVFARTGVSGGGAQVHQGHLCSPGDVRVPQNRGTAGRRRAESSSVRAVEDTVADTDPQDDRVNRTVSLPRAEVALLAQQRRLLSAALNVDLTDGAMLALLIQECLVGWVGQKVVAATRPSRPPTRGEGRNRRRRG